MPPPRTDNRPLVFGHSILAAAGALTPTVVLLRGRRVARVQYTPGGEQLASHLADEAGAVVALEDQRRAVLPDQRAEDDCGGDTETGLPENPDPMPTEEPLTPEQPGEVTVD